MIMQEAQTIRVTGAAGWRAFRTLAAAGALAIASSAHGDGLSLVDAEAIALDRDPALQAVQSRRAVLEELAVAGGQLPDPMLRAGIMSLPTDTWELGQEPMTQVQVGLSQKFPRGRTRELRSEQMRERSAVLGDMLQDQRLRIALSVREEYLEVLKQQRLAEINADAIEAFSDLADITQDYYATGRVQQQDVLRAAVELAKVEDRATRIAQEGERARARLEAWIGDAAHRPLDAAWPNFGPPISLDQIQIGLTEHPRVRALQRQVEVADTGIELADQRYKPEFGIDVTYGGRGGNGMDGSSRPDLFSIMVMMDLPLFHENRQDRYRAAALAESSAAAFDRDDIYRRMRSEASVHHATLERQQQRIGLFEDTLLPDAEFNAAAALSAYQAALDSLTTLMRARITEYELQLEYATLLAEVLKTRARLQYFEGESS
jgi:outer membrane protein TolC